MDETFTIYWRENCPHCTRAKQILQTKEIPFFTFEVGVDIEVDELKTQFPKARTLPVVTINGVYIGGADQLATYLTNTGR